MLLDGDYLMSDSADDPADDPYRYSYDPSGAEEIEWKKQQRKWEREREREDDRALERLWQREKEQRQEKYEELSKQSVDNYNAIIVKYYGETSRKIITDEDQKHMGKAAQEKMNFFFAIQAISSPLWKKGTTKLEKTDRDHKLMQLCQAVCDNGLKALQMKELADLKPLIDRSDIKKETKVKLKNLISKEISGR